MKLLFDFLPIVFFFIVFKFYGIYYATAVAIITSLVQAIFSWLKHRRLETMHLLTLGLIVLLGGATLWLQDEVFIKWKPTAVNWAFALAFIIASWVMRKPLIRVLLEKNVTLTDAVWHRLNISWIIFFIIMGIANLYVIYHFSTDIWVDFKLFGVLGLTLIFIILQAVYLAKHADLSANDKSNDKELK